jgi:hypothetical protein
MEPHWHTEEPYASQYLVVVLSNFQGKNCCNEHVARDQYETI